nr:GDSL esterase/lipase At1g29670-like [Ipomoea trifida]
MASGLQIWLAFTILLLIIMFSSLAEGEPQVPCYFIFGDSLVDNGNNNNLSTKAKANYPPYGIDFPDGPTGRFTNGRNIADFLVELLGFTNARPPFAAATTTSEEEIMKGVNYASGAGGVLERTGKYLGDRHSFERQLRFHNATVSRIGLHVQNLSLARTHLRKCLYSVGLGSNDYLHEFLGAAKFPAIRQPLYTPQRFASILIKQYAKHLRTLYGLGARKVAVFGIGKLGCIPGMIKHDENGSSISCADSVNDAVEKFDNKLKILIHKLNRNLSGAKFIFLNMTSISHQDLPALGISIVDKPCCKVSTTVVLKGQCEPNVEPCSNRGAYMFWDNYHPSQISSMAIAKRSYTSSLVTDAYPMDIRSLIQLNVQKM